MHVCAYVRSVYAVYMLCTNVCMDKLCAIFFYNTVTHNPLIYCIGV